MNTYRRDMLQDFGPKPPPFFKDTAMDYDTAFRSFKAAPAAAPPQLQRGAGSAPGSSSGSGSAAAPAGDAGYLAWVESQLAAASEQQAQREDTLAWLESQVLPGSSGRAAASAAPAAAPRAPAAGPRDPRTAAAALQALPKLSFETKRTARPSGAAGPVGKVRTVTHGQFTYEIEEIETGDDGRSSVGASSIDWVRALELNCCT